MLYQIDYARCYYIKSTEDGKSCTESVDITHVIEEFKKVYDLNVLVSKVIDPGIAGYSDLAVTPDGLIHCFYEGGSLTDNHFLNNQISIISFTLEWLTDGKDKLDKKDKPLFR